MKQVTIYLEKTGANCVEKYFDRFLKINSFKQSGIYPFNCKIPTDKLPDVPSTNNLHTGAVLIE